MGDGPCTCGHEPEEHHGTKRYPGSTKCHVKGCDCIAYEEDQDGMAEAR